MEPTPLQGRVSLQTNSGIQSHAHCQRDQSPEAALRVPGSTVDSCDTCDTCENGKQQRPDGIDAADQGVNLAPHVVETASDPASSGGIRPGVFPHTAMPPTIDVAVDSDKLGSNSASGVYGNNDLSIHGTSLLPSSNVDPFSFKECYPCWNPPSAVRHSVADLAAATAGAGTTMAAVAAIKNNEDWLTTALSQQCEDTTSHGETGSGEYPTPGIEDDAKGHVAGPNAIIAEYYEDIGLDAEYYEDASPVAEFYNVAHRCGTLLASFVVTVVQLASFGSGAAATGADLGVPPLEVALEVHDGSATLTGKWAGPRQRKPPWCRGIHSQQNEFLELDLISDSKLHMSMHAFQPAALTPPLLLLLSLPLILESLHCISQGST